MFSLIKFDSFFVKYKLFWTSNQIDEQLSNKKNVASDDVGKPDRSWHPSLDLKINSLVFLVCDLQRMNL